MGICLASQKQSNLKQNKTHNNTTISVANASIPQSYKSLPQKQSQIINKPQNNPQPILQNQISNHQQDDKLDCYKDKLQNQKLAFISSLPNSLTGKYKFATNASKQARIRKQINNFGKMLPCEKTNSIFVRCDEQRCDIMNILISGSTQTPYSSGLYLFELVCPDAYPAVPPKMELLTGRGKFRFNPNLYQNGYICLSILGTWSGSQNEMWQPEKSNLLQVFLSIQGLVMTNDVYFNQPSYITLKGTPTGELQNTGYSNIVKLANIRFAMIETMRNPPFGFQNIVRHHFTIKRQEILQECQLWISQADKKATYTNVQNSLFVDKIRTNPSKYKQILKETVEQLKNQLDKLQALNK